MPLRSVKTFLRVATNLSANVFLSLRSLDHHSANKWAERSKRWPALLMNPPFKKTIRVNDGFRMRVGLIDVIERTLLVSGEWDPHIASFLRKNIVPGMTVLDVGANIGYFTLLSAKLCGPGGYVIAVEPSHRALGSLMDHLVLNDSRNVIVLSTCAGSRSSVGKVRLLTSNNVGASTMRPGVSENEGNGHYNLAIESQIGPVLSACGVIPQLIKIDVEGYELEVLRGLVEFLETSKLYVICELTDNFLKQQGDSAFALLKFMEELGYSCMLLNSVGDVRCGDRLSPDRMPEDQADVVFYRQGNVPTL